MLKRKIEIYLRDWKQKNKKKSLIVEGPRQVGKTTSVIDFANQSYDSKHILYIDFHKRPELIEIFEPNLDAGRIIHLLRVYFPEVQLVKGESILIFDNVQECERALISLRSFTSQGEYDVIAIGSFLGNMYKTMNSFPVGYVERYAMGSLDFEEFCWANGYEEDIIDVVEEHFTDLNPLLKATHNVFMDLFREYMAIGGMPQVVAAYTEDRDFKQAYSMLEDLLELYENDIIRYSPSRMGHKAVECLNSLPVQLYRDNKKFQYKSVSEGGRRSKYEASVEWLIDAGIVLQASNVKYPKKPLHSNVRSDCFKLYLHDPGLFVAMLGDEIQLEILRGGMDAYNGAIYETVMASLFSKVGQTLYYFEKNSKLSVDFLITRHREMHAVEVKSADNPKSKVLPSLIENYGVTIGVKMGTKNIEQQDHIVTMPIYMVMFMERN
ncbi:ATP-binding protein [Candidatus Xianfuyuplasma coldseepsis]|uniref:ATP-binding protein n=1 Tax=Candidatus Xianfuyuplasma coldseepsis TaxID=2782163 RepID=A0A7L7KSW1_9MOLU|nr:ATP-binding protein [Xianfuyuplasma coldseepsis]QMS85362.1 ATP-binding protein [Xianfuyuplasma coldseepsis]